ncbi:MAG: hypothetical protein AAFP13_14405 [Pseudomonadota bacterium]
MGESYKIREDDHKAAMKIHDKIPGCGPLHGARTGKLPLNRVAKEISEQSPWLETAKF